MKIFLYDTKHQQVIAEKEMGNLNETQIELVNRVIDFLDDNLLTDGRYKNITLAEAIDTIYDDGEPQLVIRDTQ